MNAAYGRQNESKVDQKLKMKMVELPSRDGLLL
jgi:hypothetical protein